VDDAVTLPVRSRDPRLRLLLFAYAVLYAAAWVSSILAPRWVADRSELLIAGSARIRHLLFVVPAGISPGAYAGIGFARMMVSAAVCYLLGRWYGTRGFAWLDRQLMGQRPAILRWLERLTDRYGWLSVFLMPGSNVVCALVGHSQMRPRTFFSIVSAGIAFRLVWVWVAAKRWEAQLDAILDWIARYQWWLVGAFFAVAVLQSVRQARAMQRAIDRDTVTPSGLGERASHDDDTR
jgi:hypothetical protein